MATETNNEDIIKDLVNKYKELEADKNIKNITLTFGFIYGKEIHNAIKILKLSKTSFCKKMIHLVKEIPDKTDKELLKGITLYENLINSKFSNSVVSVPKDLSQFKDDDKPRNKIYFGAPGTGKSYQLKKDIENFIKISPTKDNSCRVTFHPDYTYSDFVGTYKPKMNETNIEYSFVPGPFLKTYLKAIQNPQENFMLIIEEINRANVAAVFGDVFQLLDRDSDGVSEYEIDASEDIKDWLQKKAVQDIEKKLKIPSNMFIWATMNSADQDVFPMDTAFKRRWDFEYIGINDKENELPDKNISKTWNEIRTKINNKLLDANINEDKCIGPFFISKNILDTCDENKFIEVFNSKVIMYLYEDVLKHRKDVLFRDDKLTYSEICNKIEKSEKEAIFEKVNETLILSEKEKNA